MFQEAVKRATGKKLFPAVNIGSLLGRDRDRSQNRSMVPSDPVGSLYGSLQKLLYGRTEGLILHVTSATHGEGVSTISRALADRACVAGHSGVILLKDFSEAAAQTALPQDLVSCISRGEAPERAATILPGSDLLTGDLLGPVGTGAPDPNSLYDAYNKCRNNFKLIIIDCGPASGGRYFELIPSAADGVILVVRAESTRPAVVLHSKAMIEERGGILLSVVLNRVKHYIPRLIYDLI